MENKSIHSSPLPNILGIYAWDNNQGELEVLNNALLLNIGLSKKHNANAIVVFSSSKLKPQKPIPLPPHKHKDSCLILTSEGIYLGVIMSRDIKVDYICVSTRTPGVLKADKQEKYKEYLERRYRTLLKNETFSKQNNEQLIYCPTKHSSYYQQECSFGMYAEAGTVHEYEIKPLTAVEIIGLAEQKLVDLFRSMLKEGFIEKPDATIEAIKNL